MFEKLKRQSLKKSLVFTVILVVAAVALLVSTGFGVFKAIGGPKDLYSLSRDQVDGAYVEGEIYGLYGSYAETTKNSRTVSREYIIGVTDEVGYMGLVLRSEDLSAAEDLLRESWDYLDGLTDGTSTVIHVRGTVLPMDEESLEFYHETVGWDEMSAEQQAMFLPYYLKADFLGKSHADAILGLYGAGGGRAGLGGLPHRARRNRRLSERAAQALRHCARGRGGRGRADGAVL